LGGRSLFVHRTVVSFASRTATVAVIAVTITVAAVFPIIVIIEVVAARTERETPVIMKSVRVREIG